MATKSSVLLAKKVLRIEIKAIQGLLGKIGKSFDRAVDLIFRCAGRAVITGMGKPGLIGRKIAATLASTGTPSLFVHPAEAIHGDLGMVTKQDIVVAISNSGETEEIVKLLSTIKKIGSGLIAMTGNVKSTLARNADVVIDIGVSREACPLGLAPTASTTVTLAMGDALAIALQQKRGFKPDDFAVYHPGGSLGKKLLRVKDLMRTGRGNPAVKQKNSVKETLLAITAARAGSCSIVDSRGRLIGIFTDGDLRRHLENGTADLMSKPVWEIASRRPTAIHKERLAAEALSLLREKKIDELPVVDDNRKLVGLLDVQDLLKAGFI
jgi:arabinose-5-phosphate isomerase